MARFIQLARADELCDKVRVLLEAVAARQDLGFLRYVTDDGTTVPPPTITAVCEDDPDADTVDLPPGQLRVYVGWEKYEDAGPVSRGEQATDYLITILTAEVCPFAGKVPLDWRRSRSKWVDEGIVNAIAEARDLNEDGNYWLGGAYALRVDGVAFSLDELTERKVFWCGVGITLRDCREVC